MKVVPASVEAEELLVRIQVSCCELGELQDEMPHPDDVDLSKVDVCDLLILQELDDQLSRAVARVAAMHRCLADKVK